ncbi:transcriptional regulator [Nocardioides sp. TRM66260-LWL]|uniref:transcriptional regulator n=1 Tax=Nocardioides sp. TRM66260-LWL TaxID=2874478 RepID=UPI001CC4AEF6|nr:transcriptional regulator [Nocardioides sp. TRM66260-LWL]MBZ5735874.1 transcriptional regulator [Nocardioides sp. TRM66260-LWL]
MIADLDPVIHAPKRLAAMALLAVSTQATFPTLRERLAISDSDLSKQMSALEAAGYVEVRRSGRGRGSVTSFRITDPGRAAYRRHREALEAILGTADEAATT